MTNKNDYLSHVELQKALDNDETTNNFKTAADLLLSAINDYPTFNLIEPIDLVAELRKEIKDKLTFCQP
jgi:hypothetical protein